MKKKLLVLGQKKECTDISSFELCGISFENIIF